MSFGADPIQVAVPRLARIGAQFVCGGAEDQVPGAFDVRGGEGLAVMPAHSLPELKGQLGHIGIPRPFGRQIGLDRVDPVLRHVLPEENQVVEDRHHRVLGRIERLLVDRHARRAVVLKHPEHTAVLFHRRRLERLFRRGARAVEPDDAGRHDYPHHNCHQNNRYRHRAQKHVLPFFPLRARP